MQDFGPGREMPEDLSDMDHQIFWSTCRPHQVRGVHRLQVGTLLLAQRASVRVCLSTVVHKVSGACRQQPVLSHMSAPPPPSTRHLVCPRYYQRVAPPPAAANVGSDNGKDGGRSGSAGMRTVSPLAQTLRERQDSESRETLLPTGDARGINGDNGEARTRTRSVVNDTADAGGHERVVRVANETARWVFTNQPEPEGVITMQDSHLPFVECLPLYERDS